MGHKAQTLETLLSCSLIKITCWTGLGQTENLLSFQTAPKEGCIIRDVLSCVAPPISLKLKGVIIQL